MRIIFAGTPEFSSQHLKVLMGSTCSHEIIAVYTQPDRPAGRGKKLASSPVKILAQEMGLPIYQPLSLKNSEEKSILANLKPDLIIVVAYGLLLPPEILEIPKYGCINVHASLLPKWRGAAPIQRAIEAGDKQSGITIMQMDAGLDTGDMLDYAICKINTHETGGSLQQKMSTLGPPALLLTLNKIAQHKVVAIKQDGTLSSYAKKISKDEALLDWSMTSKNLFHKILAFNPSQVTYTTLNGERIRIWRAQLGLGCQGVAPGTIVNADNSGVLVSTGQGTLLITELQMPGKKRLQASEVLRSKALYFTPGGIFGQKGHDQ